MNDSGLGPLEIDCLTQAVRPAAFSNKRKFSEMDSESNKKKCKESNNLLKRQPARVHPWSEEVLGMILIWCLDTAWDGWDALNSQLELIHGGPGGDQ